METKMRKVSTEQQHNEREQFILHHIPGLGNRGIWKLILYIRDVYGADFDEAAGCIQKLKQEELIYILGETQAKKIMQYLTGREWERIGAGYEELAKKQIRFLSFSNEDYPEHLRKIPDAPYAIYSYGKLPDPGKKKIAIVGARLCSDYGRYAAKKFSDSLSRAGADIISGMAAGIDSVAQTAALDAGGSSIAVVANGVDYCYPPENQVLYERLKEQGGIISEFPPGMKPQSRFFPMRNRIISGIADAVLIIEARQKSGTLITADSALEQGKDVYALPGRVTDTLSHGCNRLILDGAGIAVEPEQLIRELGLNQLSKQKIAETGAYNIAENSKIFYEKTLSKTALEILSVMDRTPLSMQSIYEKILTKKVLNITYEQLTLEIAKLAVRNYVQKKGLEFKIADEI